MKQIFILAFGLMAMVACTNSSVKKEQAEEVPVFTVDQLQTEGAEWVGKTVSVKGTVSHVCKHGGARCFLMGSTEDITVRVEAGAAIGSFNQEQIGNDFLVTGILQEVKVDEEYVENMESESDSVKSGHGNNDHVLGHDGEGNHEVDGGNHEKNKQEQVTELRDKIASSDKGYVPVYYIDGENYEVVE